MRGEKGITLVALVVTVIVLLILAGVSITMALSENGIITKTREAKERTQISETIEKLQFMITEQQMEAYSNGRILTKDEVMEQLELTEDTDGVIIYDGIKLKVNDNLTVIEAN